MALTVNTNIGSMILLSHLNHATEGLNKAIESMTTGFKVNHAKDNAANFCIITNLNTKINSMQIREDNASLGIELVSTISSGIESLSSHLEKIRSIALSATNGTYGNVQLSSLQQELQARLEEIKRTTESLTFENKKIFEKHDPTNPNVTNNSSLTITTNAERNTTFDELGITDLNIDVYNSSNSKINSYTFSSSDKLDKFFTVLSNLGFNADIKNGVIYIDSPSGNLLKGSLADALGISSQTKTIVTNSTSQSNNKLTYTTTQFADTTTTFGEAGLNMAGKSLQIKSKSDNSTVGTISIDSNSKSFQDLFDLLSAYGITGTMNNGIISLNTSDKYVSGDIATLLGINTTSATSTITSGQSTTSSNPITFSTGTIASGSSTLNDLGITATNLIIENSYGEAQKTLSIQSTTTLDSLFQTLNGEGITATLSDGVISLSGNNVISGELATALGISEIIVGNTQLNGGCDYKSDPVYYSVTLPYTNNEVVSSINMPAKDTLVKAVNYKDASSCEDVKDISSFDEYGATYKITSTEGLAKLATLVNGGHSGDYCTFVLMNDIDLSSIDNWTPIGNDRYSNYFKGSFYGNGHTISNMKITSSDSDYAGLFGQIHNYSNQTISDIILKNVNINSASAYIGGLVGELSFMPTIENISISGNINVYDKHYDNFSVGGLCGESSHYSTSKIDSVNVNVDINIGNNKCSYLNNFGGIVGSYNGTNITNSYVSGSIKNNQGDYVGGAIAGDIKYGDGPISNNKSTMYADAIIANSTNIYNTNYISTISNNKFMNSRNTIESNQVINCKVGNNTKLSSIGITTDQIITIKYTDNTYNTITITTDDTCWSIRGKLKDAGISAEYDAYNSYWSVAESRTTRISYVSSDLKNKLNLKEQSGAGYIVWIYNNSSSKELSSGTPTNIVGTNKLSDIGITTDKRITITQNGSLKTITVKSTDTINDLSSKLNNVGITLNLENGKITLNGSNHSFIYAMDSDLASALKIEVGKDKTYTETTKNTYTNTQPTSTYKSTITSTLTTSTMLNDIKNFVEGSIRVRSKTGAIGTINVTKSSTMQDFFNKIKNYNINGSITDGKVTLSSNGDSYLEAISGGSNLLSVLGLGSVNQTTDKITEFSPSKQLSYEKSLDDWTTYTTNFEVGGISNDPNYKIGLSLTFGVNYALDITTKQGAEKALGEVDNMLKYLSTSQSVVGSAENRLMSVLDEISISYENLVSSRSTLRDADIAKMSSQYIRNQILQQASATLLSVANQTPSIALNLL